MASPDSGVLSYSDLLLKLDEFGSPLNPLIGATRYTLIKRLKHVLQSKSSSNCNNERLRRLSRYSSGDEDSDVEQKVSPYSTDRKISSRVQIPTDPRNSQLMPPSSSSLYNSYSRLGSALDRLIPVQSRIRGFTVSSPPVTTDSEMSLEKRTKYSPDSMCVQRRSGASQIKVCRSSRGQCDNSRLEDDFETGSDSDGPGSVTSKRNLSDYTASNLKQNSISVSPQTVLSESGVKVAHTRTKPNICSENTQANMYITNLTGKYKGLDAKNIVSVMNIEVQIVEQNKIIEDSEELFPYTESVNIKRLDESCSTQQPFQSRLRQAHLALVHLLKLSPLPVLQHLLLMRDDSKSEYFSGTTDVQRSLDLTQEFKTIEDKVWISLHYQKISMILVAIVLLFFLGLALIYINVRFKESNLFGSQESGHSYPICSNTDESESMCILQKHLKPALEALEILSPKLIALAADAYCDNGTSPGGPICTLMTEEEAVDYLVENMHMGPSEARESFKNLKIVLLSNPSWAVSVSDCSSEELSYTSAYERELMEKGGLTLRNPVIPFGCQLKQLVFRLASWASFFMTTSMAVTGLLFGVWHYKNNQETRRQEMYMIVNKIIAMVKSHHERMQLPGAIGSNYISVEQCKDEILSPGCRASLVTAWKDAEKFIDKNESRISTDFKQVGGKLIRVWHWIPTTTVGRTSRYNGSPGQSLRSYYTKSNGPELLDASPAFHNGVNSSSSFNRKSRRSKMWQGQAFDTMAGSPNSLPCSPTPCLKIRHMFDPSLEHGEDWPILIQDAILEKCEGINILHIFVDCNSPEGCVFMKCSSHEEAGKAYRALHGWWFDTKLVTVKYLRTGRYHERFPEAAKKTAPLRPSNSKESSLQELWHFI